MSIRHNGVVIAGGGGSVYHPELLSHEWDDHERTDASWVNALTFSWQNKADHLVAYNELATNISGKSLTSETVAGVTIQFYQADNGRKICPDTEESNVAAIYTATGVAWYYIIDTVNERFKLPRAKHNKYADSLGVVGTGMSVGLFDGTDNVGLTQEYWTYTGHFLQANTAAYGTSAGSAYASGTSRNVTVGLTTDASKSGVVAPQTQDTDQYKYLYFYVGNFTQTALENTAGLNAELFNGKADVSTVAHVVTEFQEPTAANNYTWYRKYADGWVEQGGRATTNSGNPKQVTLPVEMADIYYNINILGQTSADGYSNATWQVMSISSASTPKSTTGFYGQPSITGYNLFFYWEVRGMAAN